MIEAGLLEIAWVEEGDTGFKLESYQAHLMKCGEWMFCSLKSQDSELYLWGRLKRNDNQLVIWFPDTARIRALVEAGSLPGKVDEDKNVTLGMLTASQLGLITSDDDVPLMEWEEPLVLVRMGR
jgi:hypothetical protein